MEEFHCPKILCALPMHSALILSLSPCSDEFYVILRPREYTNCSSSHTERLRSLKILFSTAFYLPLPNLAKSSAGGWQVKSGSFCKVNSR